MDSRLGSGVARNWCRVEVEVWMDGRVRDKEAKWFFIGNE